MLPRLVRARFSLSVVVFLSHHFRSIIILYLFYLHHHTAYVVRMYYYSGQLLLSSSKKTKKNYILQPHRQQHIAPCFDIKTEHFMIFSSFHCQRSSYQSNYLLYDSNQNVLRREWDMSTLFRNRGTTKCSNEKNKLNQFPFAIWMDERRGNEINNRQLQFSAGPTSIRSFTIPISATTYPSIHSLVKYTEMQFRDVTFTRCQWNVHRICGPNWSKFTNAFLYRPWQTTGSQMVMFLIIMQSPIRLSFRKWIWFIETNQRMRWNEGAAD